MSPKSLFFGRSDQSDGVDRIVKDVVSTSNTKTRSPLGVSQVPTTSPLALMSLASVAVQSEHLSQRLGKWGSALWRLSHGIDERPVVTSSQQKSISQERTFEDDIDDEDLIERTLFRLSDDLSRLMRSHYLKGRTLTLKIRLEDFSTFTRSQSVSDFVDSQMFSGEW